LARYRLEDLAEVPPVEMLDLEKSGVFPGRLVGAEMLHDAERRGAFERSEQARARHREIGLLRPARQLGGRQEETARMRVVDPLEGDPLAECRRLDMALVVDLLQRRADAGIVQIAVDVELVGRGLIDQLEAIGLQYGAIAEL